MSLIKRAIARIPAVGPYLQTSYWRYLEKKQKVAATKPALSLDMSVRPDPDFLRSLGYELEPPPRPRRTPDPPVVAPPLWPAEDLYFVTVCSMNHVPFARTLIEGIRRQHGPVPCVVNVVDAPARDAVTIEGAIVLTGRDTFGPELDYLALKYDAAQLCCAAKTYTLDYLLRHSPAQRFVYIDSDIYVFAPMTAMIEMLDGADFVVTPHIVAPLPDPQNFWEGPSLGGLAWAGVFNAGMFAMRRSEESQKFITTWQWLVTAPGAWHPKLGGQHEQHAFNWVNSFVESVSILRDTAFNVAYWNLHDRSLRYTRTEGGEGRWTVDGKPLVAFHYSGFSLRNPWQLSKHDARYDFRLLPAVARLRDFYVDRVKANDRGELGTPYLFDRFPSGIEIDATMRLIFLMHEVAIRSHLSPWTAEGEEHYARALLSPKPSIWNASTAPILMQAVYDMRPDLKALGDPSIDPRALIGWFHVTDAYEELMDRYRPAVPTHAGAVLLTALRAKWPQLFEGLTGAVRENRRELIARVQTVAPLEANLIHDGVTEYYTTSRVGLVRRFVTDRVDLHEAFPDFLFEDAPRLVAWLRQKRFHEHFLPVEAIDAFEARSNGRSLARLFSYISRRWEVQEAWPLGMVGEGWADLAKNLLEVGFIRTNEYDLDDLEMFFWIMDMKPWAGIPLTLELPIHTTRHPSSASHEGQQEILAPVLRRDRRFQNALAQYRRQYPPVPDKAPRRVVTFKDVSVYAAVEEAETRKKRPALTHLAPGVNVFGYHRSDIGLGQMTRGVTEAMQLAGIATSRIPLGNIRMDADLAPDDFIRKFDPKKGTNVFVSYPHLHYLLLRTIADEVVNGHRNIAYLAWEQRDGTHYWKDIYAEYDHVWALSDFAAESLTAILERKVHSVPCVVDTTLFPAASTKERHGIDPNAFTFLYIFDANSSTERKNPEAVLRAFRSAFRADDRARLIIKASGGDGIGSRTRIRRLLTAIGSDPKIEVRVEDLSRDDLYGLVSVADCYVSLHRAEGFGYTCAEAMVYGKPVIATGYSGNTQFMTEANSYPVRYREIEVSVPEGPFHRGSVWAEPDAAHAAEVMRHVYEHPDDAAVRGERGRVTIETMLSPEALSRRVRALLGGQAIVENAAVDSRPVEKVG